MELRIYTEHSPEPDEALLRAWASATDADQYDPFCCTPAWQMAFHEAFLPRRSLVIAAGDGHAAAFAEGSFDTGLPCLTPLEAHWFSGNPLLGPEPDALFATMLGALVRAYQGVLPGFMLSGQKHETLQKIAKHFGKFYHLVRYQTAEQRTASLTEGLDGWLARRSGNFRAKLRKADRRAAAQGVGYERHVPCGMEHADELYARMLAVEEKSWKGLGHCGMTEAPSRQFYHSMIRRVSQGAQGGVGRVMFATHEGEDIGFIFGTLACGVYRGQQFSYAQDWRTASIGDLLQYRQLEWLCEEGALRYDMGMSDDPRMAYKTHWAEDIRKQEIWLLIPDQSSIS